MQLHRVHSHEQRHLVLEVIHQHGIVLVRPHLCFDCSLGLVESGSASHFGGVHVAATGLRRRGELGIDGALGLSGHGLTSL